jgi:hypothetical protein
MVLINYMNEAGLIDAFGRCKAVHVRDLELRFFAREAAR